MSSKKEVQFAYGFAIVLLVIGVISYAAFPAKAPETPVRIMFPAVAGKVLFDHKMHASPEGFGVSCEDCHHHPEGGEPRACSACHAPPEQTEVAKQTCLECHDEGDFDMADVPEQTDAFHKQCIGCHDQYGAGPQSGSDECSACHVR